MKGIRAACRASAEPTPSFSICDALSARPPCCDRLAMRNGLCSFEEYVQKTLIAIALPSCLRYKGDCNCGI